NRNGSVNLTPRWSNQRVTAAGSSPTTCDVSGISHCSEPVRAGVAEPSAAVDHQCLAGDPRCGLGGEEHDCSGDVIRFTNPVQRGGRRDLWLVVFPQRLGQPGAYHARRDRVDPYFRRKLQRQLFGQVDQRSLRGVVYAEAGFVSQSSGAHAFTSKVFANRSRPCTIIAPYAGLVPALLTKMSTLPNLFRAMSMQRRAWSSSTACAATPTALPSIWAAASSAASCLSEVRTTLAPAVASACTVANPIPREAPVMIVVLPHRSADV